MPRRLIALALLLLVMAFGVAPLAAAIPADQVQQWPFASVFQLPIEAQRGVTIGTTTNSPNPTNMLDVTGSAAISSGLVLGTPSTAVPAPLLSIYSKSATWTVPTMIATPVAVTAKATVSVPGAAVGDNVVASYGPLTAAAGTPVAAGVVVAGAITAADTCTVTITNLTGAILALDAGTARCTVMKY